MGCPEEPGAVLLFCPAPAPQQTWAGPAHGIFRGAVHTAWARPKGKCWPGEGHPGQCGSSGPLASGLKPPAGIFCEEQPQY